MDNKVIIYGCSKGTKGIIISKGTLEQFKDEVIMVYCLPNHNLINGYINTCSNDMLEDKEKIILTNIEIREYKKTISIKKENRKNKWLSPYKYHK